MRISLFHYCLLALTSCSVARPVVGEVIRIGFTGVIDFIEPDLAFGEGISVGMPFEGAYGYDPSALDSAPGNPNLGAYLFPDQVLSIQIGQLTFVTPDLGITIDNTNGLSDNYHASNNSIFDMHGLTWRDVGITLRDSTGVAFGSDALPAGPPELDQFDHARVLLLVQVGHRDPTIRGTLTSLTWIPEPSALTMLGVGALGLVQRRRPRRTR